MGSPIVPLNRPLVSSYEVSIVTMPLTESLWPQFATQIFGVQPVPPFGGNGGCRGSELVSQGSGQGQPYLLFQTVFR